MLHFGRAPGTSSSGTGRFLWTRFGIPQLLPPPIAVGNKTGTWPSATHDVAFVDAPGGAYVIAVLSDRGWVWEPIARVSRAVYAVLTG